MKSQLPLLLFALIKFELILLEPAAIVVEFLFASVQLVWTLLLDCHVYFEILLALRILEQLVEEARATILYLLFSLVSLLCSGR